MQSPRLEVLVVVMYTVNADFGRTANDYFILSIKFLLRPETIYRCLVVVKGHPHKSAVDMRCLTLPAASGMRGDIRTDGVTTSSDGVTVHRTEIRSWPLSDQQRQRIHTNPALLQHCVEIAFLDSS